MRVEVEIGFSFKRELGSDYRRLELPEGSDVAHALRLLADRHPAAHSRLFDDQGRIRRHINALINGQNVILKRGFSTPLRDGDRLTILPPVGGG